MNTGQRLGLILLYVMMAANAVLMLRLFIQIVFRAAIEGIVGGSTRRRVVERPTLSESLTRNAAGPIDGYPGILKPFNRRKAATQPVSLARCQSSNKPLRWFQS